MQEYDYSTQYRSLELKLDKILEKLDEMTEKHAILDKEFYRYRSDVDRLYEEHRKCVIQPEKIIALQTEMKELRSLVEIAKGDIREEMASRSARASFARTIKDVILFAIAVVGAVIAYTK